MVKLHYDKNCPLCTSFAKKIAKKLGNKIEMIPLWGTGEEEFYVNIDGSPYIGTEAINKLLIEFPEIKDLFWMLPDRYRKQAALQGYSWSAKIRHWLFKRKNCRTC